MALKSSPFFKRSKKSKGNKFRTSSRDFVTGGVTAILGIGLLGATSNAVARI